MAIQTQSLTTILQNFAATVQGAASQLIDFTIGSVLRAIAEATAGVALWLQGQIIYVMSLTRAATSNGSDLDSWFADFSFARLPSTPASGQVTFSRYTSTFQATIPTGSLVQTGDGSQQFQVIADTTNPAYSAGLGGIVIAAGSPSVTCTVVAITPGPSGSPDASGNVLAGAISSISQAIQFVDTVTNAVAFTNGAGPESDAAARARFALYIASLSKATRAAIGSAILGVQQNLSYVLVENLSYAGATDLGYFYAVIDDGTGSPPSSLLNAVSSAIDAVRPLGSTFGVFAPVVVTPAISMTITTASGYTHSTIAATVQAALLAYINALNMGQGIPYSRLAQVAYDASPAVTNVTAVLINGGTADLAITNQQVAVVAAVNVTVS